MQYRCFFDKAFWLTDHERSALVASQHIPYVRCLSKEDKNKLIRLLCSLLYAEQCFKTQRKKTSIVIEKILKKLHLHHHLCATFGLWNFNVCHSTKFGYERKEFKKMLLDEMTATAIVIRHIVEHLGLHKCPQLIFAEFNHNPMATAVAALQRSINIIEGSRLLEDGLIGPETLHALISMQDRLPKFFNLEKIEEAMILKTLAFFSSEYGVRVEPFVPQVIVKRDLRYAGLLIEKCFKNFSELRKLPQFFHNNIHVPAYVEWGMLAFNLLSEAL
jgi:hypothetical protein